jgi:hypothetical protein
MTLIGSCKSWGSRESAAQYGIPLAGRIRTPAPTVLGARTHRRRMCLGAAERAIERTWTGRMSWRLRRGAVEAFSRGLRNLWVAQWRP